VVIASAAGALADTLPAVTEALAREHGDIRVVKAETMRGALGATVQTREFQTWLFVSFAAAALAIATVGILGMVAMSVSRRRREIGVRIALGATRGGVVRLMIREVLPSVGVGAAVGGLAAWWASGFIATSLYQVAPHDWRAWLGTTVVILGASLIAVLGPARRASAVDPVTVLRAD
jgi:ABC-type antimicrobial peptide transport system permease subunit